MRTKILLASMLAVAAFGAPADAACNGCGGAAAPGAASLALNGKGVQSRHVLTATCEYKSTPSAGSYAGSFSAEAHAVSTYDPSIAVSVSCSLSASGGTFGANGQGTNATPFDAYATGYANAPALMRVDRLCLSASAVWQYGNDHDAASVAQCIYPGAWGQWGDLTIEVPLGD